jgi:magnesium chelatase family protein
MLARVQSSTVIGIESFPIVVEVDVARGLPNLAIVGLPDSAVRESKQRVIAAIKNCDYALPPKKITVNLAPADIRKEGAGFDLPIAIGILLANHNFVQDRPGNYCILGELSLDGSLRRVRGAFPVVVNAALEGFSGVILPRENLEEVRILAGQVKIITVTTLQQAVEFLAGEDLVGEEELPGQSPASSQESPAMDHDYSEIYGQRNGKRGLEIAASGGHNLLFVGVPGSGKTMMAQRFPTILPPMDHDEIIETQKIYSVYEKAAGITRDITVRPFRSPHHSISDAGLVGGGAMPQPGEVSLAHNGVLFLDELPEFNRRVLEMLRQPLEDGIVTIARATMSLTFPSRFMLLAAMNPCPCGFLGDKRNLCNCTERVIDKYKGRISGPLQDRIDMHLQLELPNLSALQASSGEQTSATMRQNVLAARDVQAERFREDPKVFCNAQMGNVLIKKYCSLKPSATKLLEESFDQLALTARSYQRVLKMARTIADLDLSGTISATHLAEAIHYHRPERALPFTSSPKV